jgi:predicted metal-dependent enzyme (double-stranded beta helix superfamily)
MTNISRFREFVQNFTLLIDQFGNDEERVFREGKKLLTGLISHDDWLPEYFANSHPERYQQYLLYCDPMERFSIVSFVWGPGQRSPVHDHTVWGMIGVMRGAEQCEEFQLDTSSGKLIAGKTHMLKLGEVDLVSPLIGDIHKVSNALNDRPSVSIHVYGANIGVVKRHIYEFNSEHKKMFNSGYSSAMIPNIWGNSEEEQ